MTTNTQQQEIYATFLTYQKIWGDDRGNGQLEVIRSSGTKTGMSDLAVLLGGCIDSITGNKPDCAVWSASSDGIGNVWTVCGSGGKSFYEPYRRDDGARPALPSSVASSLGLSEAKPSRKLSGVDVIEYGEYPQTVASKSVNDELEKAFSNDRLQKTGKTYHFDGEKLDAYNKPFHAKEHVEYLQNGKRYIRVEAKPYGSNSILSNGKKPETGEAFWVEVQPIEWLRDPSGICVARQALLAGVQLDRKEKYDGKFDNTDMYRYLQEYFMKEIVPSKALEHTTRAKEHDTQIPHAEAKENTTHYQDIVAKGSLNEWSNRDFSAEPKTRR